MTHSSKLYEELTVNVEKFRNEIKELVLKEKQCIEEINAISSKDIRGDQPTEVGKKIKELDASHREYRDQRRATQATLAEAESMLALLNTIQSKKIHKTVKD